MENFIVKFIEKIQTMSAPNVIGNGGRTYTDKTLEPLKEPKHPSIKLSTLFGLVEYIQNIKRDNAEIPKPLLLRVISYAEVRLETAVYGPFRQRDVIAEVNAFVPSFEFGRFHDQEAFIINLNSKFIPGEDLQMVRRLASAVIDQEEVKQEDDGVSQKVTVKSGISKVADETVKPIVRLTPFRTFLEVEQPQSEFLFRIRKGASFALYEADGGAWKIEAARNIYDYLNKELESVIAEQEVIIIM